MLEDLQRTEKFLKRFLPSYEGGGILTALRDFSGALSATFQHHAAEEDPTYTNSLLRLLDGLLPPKGQEGRLDDLHDNHVAFTLYNYFGRMDAFWDNRRKGILETTGAGREKFAQDLHEFKKTPIDDHDLAQRMLAGYVIIDAKPKTPEEEKAHKKFQYWVEDIATPEFVAQHFNEDNGGGNFGKNSRIIEIYKDELPDDTFSTLLAYHHYTPRTFLISSDVRTRTFSNDGVFFEGANFRDADMRNTRWDLKTTSIRGAFFEGANLRAAEGLTTQALAHAYIDEATILPARLKYEDIMRLHEQLKMPKAPAIGALEFPAAKPA